jgi:HAD superfamily hydrolase (TIGR01490 family)
MVRPMQLALFDFDGTLTDRDTMLAFCKHVRGPTRFWLGMVWLTPVFAAMALKLIPNDRAKVLFLTHFLGGMERSALHEAAASFADHIDGWLRPGARERLDWHLAQGHEVSVVSASLDLWLMPWMNRQGLRCLCSTAAWDGDTFTGELSGPNCNHEEKVVRVRAVFDLEGFERVYAYGDSSGDQAMLALADEATFKPFRS